MASWAFLMTFFMGAFAEILSSDPVLKDHPNKSLGALFVKIGGFFPVPKKRRHFPDKGG